MHKDAKVLSVQSIQGYIGIVVDKLAVLRFDQLYEVEIMTNIRKDLLEIIRVNDLTVDDSINIRTSEDVIFMGVPLGYTDSPILQLVESYYKPYHDEIILYRFLGASRAITTLETGQLNACNMASQFENDFAEATEFYKRMEVYKPLVSDSNTSADAEIEGVKDKVHILCFSKKCKSELWEKYGKNKGCCLTLKVKTKPAFFTRFADVLYGADDLFDKVNLIQAMVKKKFNKVIFLPSIYHFALLYKRDRYRLEEEVRFVFNPEHFGCRIHGIEADSEWGGKKVIKYVDIPFGDDSQLPIKIDLVDVQYGSNIDKATKKHIESLALRYDLQQ